VDEEWVGGNDEDDGERVEMKLEVNEDPVNGGGVGALKRARFPSLLFRVEQVSESHGSLSSSRRWG
jgi:hypothetical protein